MFWLSGLQVSAAGRQRVSLLQKRASKGRGKWDGRSEKV